MLTRKAARQTDATCRVALQLATQLPEDVAEARAVLTQLGDLLEGYLIKAPREIWNRPAVRADLRGARLAHLLALSWMLGCLAVLAPIAAGLRLACGEQIAPGLVMFAGVALTALVLGQLYGLAFAALATVALNLLAVEPLFALTVPTAVEIIRACGYVIAAVGLPWLADTAERWREALIGST